MVAAMIINSCKKDEATPDATFSFTYDGTTYVSHATTAYISDTVVVGQKTLVIDGLTNNFKEHMQLMVISPDDSLLVGNYSGSTAVLVPTASDEPYIGNSIEVEITSINSKSAQGTFKGALNKSGEVEKPLTDGTFKVNIN
jgi:hypothetical protein